MRRFGRFSSGPSEVSATSLALKRKSEPESVRVLDLARAA
jgi:hypothetical protein